MQEFIAGLDRETSITAVAALPERARRLVRQLGETIEAEYLKLVQKPAPGGAKPKPVRRIRIAEVAATSRIQNEAQWNLLRDRLDETVKAALADGNEVEIA